MLKLILVLSLFGLLACSAQIVQDGQCNTDVQLAENFDADQFLGIWYEIRRSASPTQGACASIQISKNIDSSYSFIYNAVDRNVAQRSSGVGTLAEGAAKFTVNSNDGTEDFWILATNYENYALAYRCVDVSSTQRSISIWQLGRQPTLGEELYPELSNGLNALEINIADLEIIDYSEESCSVSPVFGRQEVIMTGQCNDDIEVESNFDVARFTGIWYEIASYPSDNALGDCSRANYTLQDGVVNVVNRQVLNQTLDEIRGTATLASTDGRAILLVRLEIFDDVFAEQELRVLATDYENYAVSYSCQNMDNSTRRVGSWLLSRTREFTEPIRLAVEQVIAAYPDLNNELYQQADQSPEACFYYPEPNPNTPTIFPDICELNIDVVNNFDLTQFQGIWYEIEAYPKDQQTGQCITYQFSAGTANTLSMRSSAVTDQFSVITNGILSGDSTDNSSRFTITVNNRGRDIEIPFWILSIDYNDYALAYSCVNLGDDSRAVYSWKLSRTEQLSTAASTSIADTVSRVPVLDDRYFVNTDRSNQACSSVAEVTLNEPVIIPGQCGNISAVPNFDAGRFIGRWYEIYSYFSDSALGQCNQANYALGPQGVIVDNTQVLDEALEVISGIANVISTDGSGHLAVELEVLPGVYATLELFILATDYENYAVSYSCQNIDAANKRVGSWILSRDKSLSGPSREQVDEVVNNNDDLSYGIFQEADQSPQACFYYPEPNPNTPTIFPDICDLNIDVVNNFDLTQFQGIWYEIEAYPKEQQTGQCITYQFSAGTANTLSMRSSAVTDQFSVITNGILSRNSTDNSARLAITVNNRGRDIEIPFWILSIDYNDYALAYSCVNLGDDSRAVYSWKLSRTEQLSTAASTSIADTMSRVPVLDDRYFVNTDRSNEACSSVAEVTLNEPVIIPGQCGNISAVPNFDAGRFIGRWYEIYSYFSESALGQCNQANYALGSQGVIVDNTQVLDQALEVISGIANVISTDGSGHLAVELEVLPGVYATLELFILATDYENYAVSYSCQNIDAANKRVGSWILSRDKSLSGPSREQVDEVVNNNDDLSYGIFQEADQSPQACFYYPEPNPNTPTIFPDICDLNIDVVNNFDLTQFQGIWYEIEAYPKEQQTGQCITYQFSAGTANTLSMRSSAVTDQFSVITNGILSRNSTDNSARLAITVNNRGRDIEIPFWILSIDYNDYALAYSCVNLGDDSRAVYSWKLSRTEQLSTAASTSIADTMSRVPVLDDRYFVNTDRSNQACSSVAEVTLNEPVIIPGQCGNISAVPNFDAGRFIGRWYEIYSYFSESALGQCNQANYALGPQGVIVDNTQVLDQALEVISGIANVISTDGSGHLAVELEVLPGVFATLELFILATDYENYAVSYSCQNIDGANKRVGSWILSRDKTLSGPSREQVDEVVNNDDDLSYGIFQEADQSPQACFYYPEPNPNTPTIFPDICDLNIDVVNNFDLTQFQGTWYEIEAYPKEQQTGQCITYQFSAGTANTLSMRSSAVTDQFSVITNGVLSRNSTDNSARLAITVNNRGRDIEIPFWILSIDYNDYALAYSCVNLGDDSRAVYSWKLSRTEQLSTAASTSIADTMSRVPVLDDRYFVNTDRSNEACSSVAEVTLNEPVIIPGQCGNISAVPNFDAGRFIGRWYEIYSYFSESALGQCNQANYALGPQGVIVDNTQVLDQALEVISGIANVISTDGSGHLAVELEVLPGVFATLELFILATDYENYAVSYSCQNVDGANKRVGSWILSRDKSLSGPSREQVDEIVNNNDDLSYGIFQEADQSPQACFYYPEPNPNTPTIFPDTCELNIDVVNNFDLTQFQGIWYEIEAYPKEQQTGQCINYQFSAETANTLSMRSSAVTDQFSVITNGILSRNSTDNSARLAITVNNRGRDIEIPFWILSIDYNDYALAYSCVNLGDDSRAVYSWKLSRTEQLSTAASTSIADTMSRVPVLDDRYFVNTDRSNEACSSVAEVTLNEPVIIPGQCGNISAVPNFDAGRFIGRWYEIYSYFSESALGQCNQANYALGPQGVIVDNTQVLDQALEVISGIANVISTDGSGHLAVELEVLPGVFATLELFILATDYENYAVSYSCQNVDGANKRVGSWILSRDKSLSGPSREQVDEIVNNNDDLSYGIFQEADQSPQACFYYPEPNPNTPTIFPDTCELNIDVVNNFDLTQFQGIWYEIEAYPKEQQTGQCITYQFSAETANTLSMRSSAVTDQFSVITNGILSRNSTDNSARLAITVNNRGRDIEIPFWILSIDYNDYALAYSCVNLGDDSRAVYSWKLSRTEQLSTAASTSIADTMSRVPVLDDRYFVNTDRSNEACSSVAEVTLNEPVIIPGQCGNISAVPNFDAGRFIGRWYEIYSYFSESALGQCNQANYALGPQGVIVDNTQVLDQALEVISGIANVISTDGSGHLAVELEVSPGVYATLELFILATDYENYAVSYSCQNIDAANKRVGSWILSRDKSLSGPSREQVDEVVNNNDDLSYAIFQEGDQSPEACFYYPEPNPAVPVVFPSRCDPNITVMPNFDPVRYLGLWHDIESYPSLSQMGECKNALYALGEDVVDVYNTQVLNQALDTINGTAVVSSTDGTARLLVTFDIEVNGIIFAVETSYYILDTDYDTYSLVYTCVDNEADDTREVYSWKLSRTKELPESARVIMDNIIETVPVLDQRYYKITDQSDDGCFYLPEVPENEAPEFVGQCDETIPVVENFDVERYMGTWYDIESYTQPFQDGTCATATYELNNGIVDVYNTQVRNEELDTINATAVPASNDGLAKLLVTFPIAGTDLTVTVPYWILETDYTSYALVYSCENVSSDRRRVTSWKLSRTRTLTDEAVAVMNNRIETINVLDDRYYLQTGHSAADCFYYPEFDLTPDTIISLPGGCDQSIQAMPNFNAGAYLGRWFEMARYPTGDQFGQCAQAVYELGDGVVEVTNYQVVDAQLMVQEGSAVVVSVDGSGLLNVTFVVNGETRYASYYVLESDYDNYALVYSCRDMLDGNRIVTSWKLSRDRSGLSAQANEIITNRIQITQGLSENYYLNTSQSDEDCFYIPEQDASSDMLFRGQCEDITGVQNFDIQRYLGWWHEIERYPTAAQPGECISSRFEASGNQYLVVDTSVVDQNGQTESSTVTATTNGLLRRTLSNGQTVDTWVLATDYETYSLLYSCENVDEEFRRVWSAKHSKSRQLTNAAQNAMAPVIENNRVLYPQLYLEVDQSDSACFYYPPYTGEPIVLRGQCDDDIPVVQNFEAGEYTGTWYQMERYPQTFELDGECTGARYELDEETGVVRVTNWEVIGGELDVIIGNATISSTDGSAKLIVVLPSRAENAEESDTVTSPLYVLTTDYISHALAYSCVNINEHERQLGVWKLSRTRSMPASGTAAINAYMATRPELNQEYFLSVPHNEDCLEPSSGMLVKSSVIVLLICVVAQLLV